MKVVAHRIAATIPAAALTHAHGSQLTGAAGPTRGRAGRFGRRPRHPSESRAFSAWRMAFLARAAASVRSSSRRAVSPVGLLRIGLEPGELGAQVVDALPQVVTALAGLRRASPRSRVSSRSASPDARSASRSAFSAALRARRSARSSRLGGGASGTPGRLPADRIRDIDRVEPARLQRADESRGHDRGGGRGIHHRRVDGLLDVARGRRR